MNWPLILGIWALCYLLGSLPTSLVICRILRLPDPRFVGSKNPGATNVVRTGGKLAGILTLAGDAGKGYLALWGGQYFLLEEAAVAFCLAAVIAGHSFSVFLGFRGGKGIATGLGAVSAISPICALLAVVTWLGVLLKFRISSVAGMTTFLALPLYIWLLSPYNELLWAFVGLSVFILATHRSNIAQLIRREEPTID